MSNDFNCKTLYFYIISPGGDLHTKVLSPMCGEKSWIQGRYFKGDVDPRLPRLGYNFYISQEIRVQLQESPRSSDLYDFLCCEAQYIDPCSTILILFSGFSITCPDRLNYREIRETPPYSSDLNIVFIITIQSPNPNLNLCMGRWLH